MEEEKSKALKEIESDYLYEILTCKRKPDKKLGFLMDGFERCVDGNPDFDSIKYRRNGYIFTVQVSRVEEE